MIVELLISMTKANMLSHQQIVWFLAPTVPLCYQQFYAISSQIQSVQGRIIAGDADIKAWSTQAIWYALSFLPDPTWC